MRDSLSSSAYTLVLIQPSQFIHVEAFREIIEAIQCGLAAFGLMAPLLVNCLPDDGSTAIVFGAHHLDTVAASHLPPNAIIYNAEPLVPTNNRLPEFYYLLLSRHVVWDFSRRNVDFLNGRFAPNRAYHLPLSQSSILTRLQPSREDIDILFYGAISPRRESILKELGHRGAKISSLTGIYGAERNDLIGRAKLVLNMHFDDDGAFECMRVVPLLANAKAVVTEFSSDIPDALKSGMCVASYDDLVDSCMALLADEVGRQQLALQGFRCIASDPEPMELRLANLLGRERITLQNPSSHPRVLLAGSGNQPHPAYVNADKKPQRHPDWLVDFGDSLPFGKMTAFGRHGQVLLQPGMFDTIIAVHLLEHIEDLVTAMTNFLLLLKNGGVLHIEVPYDLSCGAWQDPTHVRAFNERSWIYYCDWHHYLDWIDARFDLISLTFMLSPSGRQMKSAGRSEAEILATPRAVDAMRVSLVKRSLNKTSPSQ